MQRLLRYFLAGVFAILPVVITVGVVIWVANFVGAFIGPGTLLGSLLERVGGSISEENKIVAYIIGWALVLGLVFLFGVLIEFGARRMVQRIVDTLLNRIPLVGSIYDTSKRLVDMLNKKDDADLQGMSVVFCTFGKDSGVGLLALLVSPEKFTINGRDYQVVIVPTAPVPVGGGLLFVPADSVIDADMSVNGLMSIYVSMGVTASEFVKPTSDSSQ
jgi:uncharacterized membrane protein